MNWNVVDRSELDEKNSATKRLGRCSCMPLERSVPLEKIGFIAGPPRLILRGQGSMEFCI